MPLDDAAHPSALFWHRGVPALHEGLLNLLGPRARTYARLYGKAKPETFDFPGFTHYCTRSRSRDGKRFRMKRRTSAKRFRGKLAAFQQWLRENRAKKKTRELWIAAGQKLAGHYQYYGVTDNFPSLNAFAHQAEHCLHKWLNRRGGRKKMSWEKFHKMAAKFPLPRPRIHVSMFQTRPNRPQQLLLPLT